MRQKIIPILIVLLGFALLSYPFISNYMFEKSAGSTIKSYEKQAKTYDQKQKDKAFQEAKEYNEDLTKSAVQLTDPFKAKKSDGETMIYNNILNLDHSGIMGYLEIPCISVNLPIYHGTDAEILERGVGHLAASSIPVGGKSTHSVLTGHTGLSSAKLFTDLTEMKNDDLFFIHVLDRTLAYKVDQISVVKPEDTEKLQIIEGKDYVTLVTCTPYGVNDHRLLVRGARTKYEKTQESSIRPRIKIPSGWELISERSQLDLQSLWHWSYREKYIKSFEEKRQKKYDKKKERRNEKKSDEYIRHHLNRNRNFCISLSCFFCLSAARESRSGNRSF